MLQHVPAEATGAQLEERVVGQAIAGMWHLARQPLQERCMPEPRVHALQ